MIQFRCAACGGYEPISRSDRKKFDNRLTNLRGMKCDDCMNWFPSGTLVKQHRHATRWWELESGSPGSLEDDSSGSDSIWTH